jgi:hypothetical protein
MTCKDYQDLLLEYLYDLLDSEQSTQLRQHVSACPACAAALAQAERYQRLLAEAARPCREVPLFVPPAEEPATQEPVHPPVPRETVSQLPSSFRAARRWRPAAVLATAAALVLLAFGGWLGYSQGLAQRTQQLDLARAQLQHQERQLRQLEEELRQQLRHLDQQLRQQFFLVEMDGPAVYTPGAASRLRIQTRDLSNRTPLPSTLQAQLLEPDSQRVLYRTQLRAEQGQALLLLPGDLPLTPGKPVRLQVTAQGPASAQHLQQDLAVEVPNYLAQVALNSTQLYPGKPLQIRALLLERFSLRPPSRTPLLRFHLLGPQGQTVWQAQVPCDSSGLAQTQLTPANDWPEGIYRLQLTTTAARVITTAPQLERPAAPRPVAAAPRDARLRRERAASWQVQFFPEGGQLVAGLPARLWCQVQAPAPLRQVLTARLSDLQGNVLQESIALRPLSAGETTQAVGVVTFTPQAKPSYRLQLYAGKQLLGDYPLPAVQEHGVTLQVPAAVGKEGEPIAVRVQATEPQPALLLLAECRGQVVDQQWVSASPAGAEVRLTPLPGSCGAVRLAVYEPRGGQLVLRSQRWVYLAPRRFLRLDVAGKAASAPTALAAGTPLTVTVRAVTEAAQPAAAWALALVTPAASGTAAAAQLGIHSPDYFYLELVDQETHPSEDLLLSNPQMLEWFLVRKGGAPAVVLPEPAMLAASPPGQPPALPRTADAPAVFQRTNREKARASYQAAWTEQVGQLRRQFDARQTALRQERAQAEQAVQAALQTLINYQQTWSQALRLGLALLWLVLLAGGLGALAWSLYRLWRGLASATMPLASALASLALALVLWLTAGWLIPSADHQLPPEELLAQRGLQAAAPEQVEELPPLLREPAAAPPTGVWQEQRADRLPRRQELSRQQEEDTQKDAAKASTRSEPQALPSVPGAQPLRPGAEQATPRAAAPLPQREKGVRNAPAVAGAPQQPSSPSLLKSTPSGDGESAAGTVPSKKEDKTVSVFRSLQMANLAAASSQSTVLSWQPALALPQGQASFSVVLPPATSACRVWVLAHDGEGRLGWTTLEVTVPKK